MAFNAGSNLWYATRQQSGDAFSTAAHIVPSVNSDFEDGDPALSADGCELYFASTRSTAAGSSAQYHLYKAVVQH